MGDSVCVAISIINDNIPEMNKENFFVIIKSNDANISPGLGSATILIQDSDQGMLCFRVWYYHHPIFKCMVTFWTILVCTEHNSLTCRGL